MTSYIFPIMAIFFGSCMMLMPLFTYASSKDIHYSMLRYFPCEIAREYYQKVILICIGAFFSMMVAESFATALIRCNTALYFSAMIIEIISSIGLLASLAFGLEYYRLHLVADVIFFLGEIGGDIMLLFTVIFSNGLRYEFSDVIAVIMGIIGLILLCLLFIPQLKKWMYLEKTEENGKTIYIRPKISILALVEWIFIGAQMLNMLLLIINALIV